MLMMYIHPCDLKLLLENLRSKVENHYEAYHYYLGINDIMECLRATNLVIHTEKPWELKKNGNLQRLGYVLNLSLQSVTICGILLRPQRRSQVSGAECLFGCVAERLFSWCSVTNLAYPLSRIILVLKQSETEVPDKIKDNNSRSGSY